MKNKTRRMLVVPLTAVFALLPVAVGAQSVDSVIAAVVQKNQAGAQSQQRIDNVVDQTQDLLQEYKVLIKELEGLNVYNQLLGKQVDNQQTEMQQLDTAIDRVTVIERQITPLMVRMTDGLGRFIEADAPFLPQERQKRLDNLRNMMELANVTVAEKFRKVMEAYTIEYGYGRDIETYRGTLNLDGQELEVDFLRIGRVALIYQTLDSARTGRWNQETRQWEEVPDSFTSSVREALRVAGKQKAPDLLLLPLSAPEDVQ